ncbi:MAG: KilA-N domain-containing protein [Candidatus Taylorbacteria bacterium]|nr:KilA-N domain-containing protein [Candidatus Taylorbacteria bacterium]
MKKITTLGVQIHILEKDKEDFISLTDIARFKDVERSDYILQNWMRNMSTIEFLGLWEKIHNPSFNSIEFDGFKNRAGANSFSLTPKRWIESTGAIGIMTKSGRYGGGTFAHKDIAFEFATWISSEFKLYLIKEFQRLKLEENERLVLGWDVKRMLTKINYKIHTDAIKEYIIPVRISIEQVSTIYANEADVLNKALFGMTAKEWRDSNPKLDGNIRDYADVSQLVCLANLENLNAEYIRVRLEQKDRLIKLNESAISQMKSLANNGSIKKLK